MSPFLTLFLSYIVIINGENQNLNLSIKKDDSSLHYSDSENEINDTYSSCDLTSNECDINCCNDKDCLKFDIKSFNCTIQAKELQEENPFKYNILNCYNQLPKYLKYSSNALCFETQNSPYLGQYFHEDNIIFNENEIPEILKQRRKSFIYFKTTNIINKSDKRKYPPNINIIGEKINYYFPANIFGTKYCSEIPSTNQIDYKSFCLKPINERFCNKNTELQKFYEDLKMNLISFSINERKFENINISIKSFCTDNGTDYLFLYENNLKYSFINENKQGKIIPCRENKSLTFNNTNKICQNVIVDFSIKFTWNFTNLMKIDVEVILVDIPLFKNLFTSKERENIAYEPKLYLSQNFMVSNDYDNQQKSNLTNGYSFGSHIVISNLR
ncbi:hypothetical protein O3M35_010200 [Rhynocoris fuscipes]|uniref:Tectonic-1-3 N-terminal domain-containing protein n=1 Tax=Rhynocoris fuscipes TaxID=488301 RepID=A0AAW1D0W3_9HEMI